MQEVVVFRTLTSDGYKTNHKADRYSGEAVQGVDIDSLEKEWEE